jgi:hypothetical protein
MLAAVAITDSVNRTPGQAHVFCGPCWFGEEVPEQEALAVAAKHEASPGHLEAELDDIAFELLADRLRVKRGH